MFQQPTTALLRHLSPSFTKCVTSVDLDSVGAIDMDKANTQHDLYAEAVKSCIDSVVEVEADASHPDCCFIEDTLVICGDTVVVNNLGHESRRGEVVGVQKHLGQISGVSRVWNMSDSKGAHIDGGDVLTLPSHQFVGLSKRSNLEGVEFLRSAFDGKVQVHAIDMLKITGTTLHLKCLVSALDQTTIVVADNASGRAVFAEMQRIAEHLTPIYVPDEVAANVLSFPWAKPQPTVLIQANFPASETILREKIPSGWRIITLDMSELIKADGALTCCSVLF
ncbi:UNVERIFIED_CONTAM: N(G),N(G)-dimethylarginine dimethylaminohydrolase 1 [Siphonaria sp. JEL0065]|nr:N(G),N(G)-dimethylarginine dimethylaminohydrolase 1 [Siphonaria sp. JEL0065]